MIEFTTDSPTGIAAGSLRYKEVCLYNKCYYMRVASQDLKIRLEKKYSFNARTGTGSLNTKDEVLMVKLNNGKITVFQRTTVVRRVTLRVVAIIGEEEDS